MSARWVSSEIRGPATNAKINQCNDVEIGHDGKIYITDNLNNRIRVVYTCDTNSVTTQPLNDTISATAGGFATFTVTTSAVLPTYQWQQNTGSGFVNLTNVAPYSGVYTPTLSISIADNSLNLANYRCIVLGDSTCSDTSSAAVLRVYGGLSIENTTVSDQPHVYPNPTTGILSVLLPGNTSNVQLTVLNLYGSSVMETVLTAKENTLDMCALPAGVYFFKFVETNNSYSVKVIKQ